MAQSDRLRVNRRPSEGEISRKCVSRFVLLFFSLRLFSILAYQREFRRSFPGEAESGRVASLYARGRDQARGRRAAGRLPESRNALPAIF